MATSLSSPASRADGPKSEKDLTSAVSSGFDFVLRLLLVQKAQSAVETFSELHEQGTVPSQEKYYSKLLPTSLPSSGEQYGFHVDLDKCSGCKSCVVACHSLNGLEEEESWRRVGSMVIGDPEPEIQYVTTACHHCQDPGCLNGCPVAAYEKDPLTGIVKHLDDQCIGCKYCTMTCPYEVPQYSKRLGIVRKCDMCSQRLAVGEAPACVQACPNEAIEIRLVPSDATFASELVPGAPESCITRPTTEFFTSNEQTLAALAIAQDDASDQPEENHWPLAIMLVLTQASVGVLLVERLTSILGTSLAGSSPSLVQQSAILFSSILALIGLGIAPKHLGQPLRAWKIFLGLRTSWLSREGVLFGKYFGALIAAMALIGIPGFSPFIKTEAWLPSWTSEALLWAATGLGLAGVYASAMIYVVTRRELWQMKITCTLFFGSALVPGLLGFALVQSLVQGSTSLTLLATCFVLGAGKLTWEHLLLWGSVKDSDSPLRSRSKRMISRHLTMLRWLRYAFGAIALGALLITLVMHAALPVSDSAGITLLGISCFAMLVGEFTERLLYFSSVVTKRMPGTL
ncbi:MAG: DmsC/YnfH family molybdoenzyme membrane anchor subunit [Planctomycetota bacterium]